MRWGSAMNVPRNTRTSVFVLTLTSLGSAATAPFLGIYLEVVRHVPLSIIGLAFLTGGILGIPVQMVGGKLVDSKGPKTVMLAGFGIAVGLCLAVCLLIVQGSSVVVILAAYIAYSLSSGLLQPTSLAIIANEGESNLRTGYALASIGGNVGSAIGPAAGGFLAGAYGYSSVFILCAVVWVVSILAVEAWVQRGRLAQVGRPDQPHHNRAPPLTWGRDRNMLILLSLMFCATFCVFYETTPLTLYAAGFLHMSDVQIGSLFTLNGVVIVILQLPLTRLFYRMRTLVMPLTFAVLFAASALALGGLASTYTQVIAVMFLFTLAEIFITAPSQTIMALFSSPDTRGMYQGYYAAVARGASFASFIGPASFQAIKPASYAWWLAAAFALATALGLALVSSPIQRDYNALRKSGHGGADSPPDSQV